MIFTTILLVFCASGSATRQIVVEPRLPEIAGQIVLGGVKDAWETISQLRDSGTGLQICNFKVPTFTIDGEPCGWAEAGWRVAGYAADWRAVGSIDYVYRLHVRQYDIVRRTAIADGHIVLTTDIRWTEQVPVGRRKIGVPIHVTITIAAGDLVGGRTILSGIAYGRADTSVFRCLFIRRIAERRASKTLNRELMGALVKIETTGRGLYAAGELPAVVGTIGVGRPRR